LGLVDKAGFERDIAHDVTVVFKHGEWAGKGVIS
jgi:hypothetical protein